jgi:hypothetical protein
VRTPHQQNSQEAANSDIECQTKTGPPMRYARIFDEPVMDEVKNPVAHKAYFPHISDRISG